MAIWSCFMVNEILMLIVLLNFLIAIVSESYARVTSVKMRFSYINKAEMNQETFLQIKLLRYICPCLIKPKRFDTFIIEEELIIKDEHKQDVTDVVIKSLSKNLNSIESKLDQVLKN